MVVGIWNLVLGIRHVARFVRAEKIGILEEVKSKW